MFGNHNGHPSPQTLGGLGSVCHCEGSVFPKMPLELKGLRDPRARLALRENEDSFD
jgi:hypothetical protein